MKAKLNFCLPAVAAMLSLMAVSGYAQSGAGSDRDTRGNLVLENPLTATPVETVKVGPEITENSVTKNLATSETMATKNSSVSKWLEARATQESGAETSADPAPSPIDDEMFMGGGWCNNCGCWLRHGCDSNGNCSLSHYWQCTSTSGDLGCSLHSGNCVSSG